MNQFFSLLVKESLGREDVAALSADNVRDCHEIEQAFKTSNGCYSSYVYRTSLQILGSFLLGLMFAFHYADYGIGRAFFDCQVNEALFLCIIPNSRYEDHRRKICVGNRFEPSLGSFSTSTCRASSSSVATSSATCTTCSGLSCRELAGYPASCTAVTETRTSTSRTARGTSSIRTDRQ